MNEAANHCLFGSPSPMVTVFALAVFILLPLLIVVALPALLAKIFGRIWYRPLPYEETHLLVCDDGAGIELRRIAKPIQGTQTPVLLIHGLGMDHRNVDPTADISLARTLVKQGEDVWLLTMRSALPQPSKVDSGLEHMARSDVPNGIREVLQRTGARHLDIVAFSMGGIVTLAAMRETSVADAIRRICIVGSPGFMTGHARGMQRIGAFPARIGLHLPIHFIAALSAPLAYLSFLPLRIPSLNLRNVTAATLAQVAVMIRDIAPTLLRSFANWHADPDNYAGGLFSFAHLGHCTQPALFLAGSIDRMAPPQTVHFLAERWGKVSGHEATFARLGKPETLEEYGHGDLMFGQRANAEVFPKILEFLAETS